MNEETVVNSESDSGTDTQNDAAPETVTVVYTEQLEHIQQYQQLQVGLVCVLIGVLLSFTVFNVLKRYL